MKKNVSGQSIGAQMVTPAGADFTGAASVFVTIDNGTQNAGAGAAPVHKGNGYHSYAPTQAETNGNHIVFTFKNAAAVTVTEQVYTTFPQSADNNPSTNPAFPPNFQFMSIQGSGYVDSMIKGFVNTTLSEPTASRINDNFEFFFVNADSQTSKIVNDVGVAGAGLTQQNVRDALKLSPSPGVAAEDSIDEYLSNNELAISSLNNISVGDVWNYSTRTLTEFTLTVDSNVTKINNADVFGAGIAADPWRGS